MSRPSSAARVESATRAGAARATTPAAARSPRSPRSPRTLRAPTFNLLRCKQCGLCAHVCPTGALEPPVRVSTTPTLPELETCTGCRTCEYVCPDFAIKMAERPPAADDPRSAAGWSPASLGRAADLRAEAGC